MLEVIRPRLQQYWAEFRSHKAVIELENKYHSLPERDRHAVHGLAVVIGLFILYQFIVSPGLGYFGNARAQYQKHYDDYHWMETVAPEVKKKSSSNDSKRSGSLLSVASGTAKKFNLSFNRFEPIGDDRVRLYLERVQFNDVVRWLGALETDMGVSAVDISLDSAGPGMVNVRLTLQG